MKPFIVCHMMSSLDGRIDCDMTEQLGPSEPYYETMKSFDCKSMLMGRVTMQMHYALPEPFVALDKAPVGRQCTYRASTSDSLLIAIDSMGKLCWGQNEYDGQQLLVVVCEQCPKAYLDYLESKDISYIVAGRCGIDLKCALEILNQEFGVERLLHAGGGNINGAFLNAGLIDELSVIIGPGIDGRAGFAAMFDGIEDLQKQVTHCQLESVQQLEHDQIWLRYKF